MASRTLWLILLISGSVVMAGEDAADGAAAWLAGAGGRGGGWAGGEVESGTPRYKLAACTLYRDEVSCHTSIVTILSCSRGCDHRPHRTPVPARGAPFVKVVVT